MHYRFRLAGKDFFVSNTPDSSLEYQELKLAPNDAHVLKELLIGGGSKMRWTEFVSLYNSYAEKNGWRLVTEKNKDVQRRFSVAVKTYPKLDDWKIIMDSLERDPFYSGQSGIYTNTCPLTLFRDSRYCSFYEAGTINKGKQKPSVDEILDEFRELLA